MCSPVVIDKEELFRDRQLSPYISDIIPGYSGFLYYMGSRHSIYLVDNPCRSDRKLESGILGLMVCEEDMFAIYDAEADVHRNTHDLFLTNFYSSCKVLPVCEGIIAESVLYAIEKLYPSFDGLQMRLDAYLEDISQFEQSSVLSDFRKLPKDNPSVLILAALASYFNLGNIDIILSMSKDRLSAIYKNCIAGLNISAKMSFGLCLVNPALTWLEPTTWTDALSCFSGMMIDNASAMCPFVLYLKGFLAATTWQHLPDIYADCLLPDFSSDVRISLEEKEAFFRQFISEKQVLHRKALEETPDRIEPVTDIECLQVVYDSEVAEYEKFCKVEDASIMKYLDPYCRAFFAFFERYYNIKSHKGHTYSYSGKSPSFVVVADNWSAIHALLQSYMSGKTNPKDIMMPVRAALDAGVITKPTHCDFKGIFPGLCPRNRSSFNDYLVVSAKESQHPYWNIPAFQEMVKSFKEI